MAASIVDVLATPFVKRRFRVHMDPGQDGADIAFGLLERMPAEMLTRVGLSDLLHPGELV